MKNSTSKPQHSLYLAEFRTEQCSLFLQHKCVHHRPFSCFHWHFINQKRRPVFKISESSDPNSASCDKENLPFANGGTFNYSPHVYCTKYDELTGQCPNGDNCSSLHKCVGDTERRYHPRFYKTVLCPYETDAAGHCVQNGPHCPYAHGLSDLRAPSLDANEQRLELFEQAQCSLQRELVAIKVQTEAQEQAQIQSQINTSVDDQTIATLANGNGQGHLTGAATPNSVENSNLDALKHAHQQRIGLMQGLSRELKTMKNSVYGAHMREFLDKDLQASEADQDWNDPAYVLANYKTSLCSKPPRVCRQGYSCPFYHNSKDRRRTPLAFKYRSTPCPQVKRADEWGDPSLCSAGDSCSLCHSRTEQQFHPEIYKSIKCKDMVSSGFCPRGPFCAFAHIPNDAALARANMVACMHKQQPHKYAVECAPQMSPTLVQQSPQMHSVEVEGREQEIILNPSSLLSPMINSNQTSPKNPLAPVANANIANLAQNLSENNANSATSALVLAASLLMASPNPVSLLQSIQAQVQVQQRTPLAAVGQGHAIGAGHAIGTVAAIRTLGSQPLDSINEETTQGSVSSFNTSNTGLPVDDIGNANTFSPEQPFKQLGLNQTSQFATHVNQSGNAMNALQQYQKSDQSGESECTTSSTNSNLGAAIGALVIDTKSCNSCNEAAQPGADVQYRMDSTNAANAWPVPGQILIPTTNSSSVSHTPRGRYNSGPPIAFSDQIATQLERLNMLYELGPRRQSLESGTQNNSVNQHAQAASLEATLNELFSTNLDLGLGAKPSDNELAGAGTAKFPYGQCVASAGPGAGAVVGAGAGNLSGGNLNLLYRSLFRSDSSGLGSICSSTTNPINPFNPTPEVGPALQTSTLQNDTNPNPTLFTQTSTQFSPQFGQFPQYSVSSDVNQQGLFQQAYPNQIAPPRQVTESCSPGNSHRDVSTQFGGSNAFLQAPTWSRPVLGLGNGFLPTLTRSTSALAATVEANKLNNLGQIKMAPKQINRCYTGSGGVLGEVPNAAIVHQSLNGNGNATQSPYCSAMSSETVSPSSASNSPNSNNLQVFRTTRAQTLGAIGSERALARNIARHLPRSTALFRGLLPNASKSAPNPEVPSICCPPEKATNEATNIEWSSLASPPSTKLQAPSPQDLCLPTNPTILTTPGTELNTQATPWDPQLFPQIYANTISTQGINSPGFANQQPSYEATSPTKEKSKASQLPPQDMLLMLIAECARRSRRSSDNPNPLNFNQSSNLLYPNTNQSINY